MMNDVKGLKEVVEWMEYFGVLYVHAPIKGSLIKGRERYKKGGGSILQIDIEDRSYSMCGVAFDSYTVQSYKEELCACSPGDEIVLGGELRINRHDCDEEEINLITPNISKFEKYKMGCAYTDRIFMNVDYIVVNQDLNK